MIERPFFILKKPSLKYEPYTATQTATVNIAVPKKITLFCKKPYDPYDPQKMILIKPGETVRTGQKLPVYEDRDAYVISTVTGTISAVSSHRNDLGQSYTSISIDVSETEETDDQFSNFSKDPSLDNAGDFLSCAPGNPPIQSFSDPERSIHTIVVSAADSDLLVHTNQYVLKSDFDAVKAGIKILKTITGVVNIIMAVPTDFMQGFRAIGAQVKAVGRTYPSSFPLMMMRDIVHSINTPIAAAAHLKAHWDATGKLKADGTIKSVTSGFERDTRLPCMSTTILEGENWCFSAVV